LINQDSLTPEQSLPVDSGGYVPQIIAGPRAVWVLTPSGLARADPATGKITAIIRTSYAPSTMSAPALIMDSAGRLWITGSLLTVVMPDTLTAYPVARTPDLIGAAADGPAIWTDTGSTPPDPPLPVSRPAHPRQPVPPPVNGSGHHRQPRMGQSARRHTRVGAITFPFCSRAQCSG
jgi:hypothetical protein